jgi:hypothetical protein
MIERDSAMRTFATILVVAVAITAGQQGAVELAARQAPDRTAAPTPGPAPSLKLPAIQKQTLSNGLPVWIVELHDVPVVDVTLAVRAGSAADPGDKFGLANLTA